MEDWNIPEQKIKLEYHVKYNPLDFAPVQAEAEYQETLFLKKAATGKPPWDLSRAGPACAMLEIQREKESAQMYLDETRRREAIMTRKFKSQYEEFLIAEQELRKHFLRFNKFVKENKDKIERAQRKYETETIVHDALLSDVAELNNQVEFYNHVKSVLLRHIEKYRAYEKYLEDVVEISPNLHSIADTHKRYQALVSAREEIAISQQRNMRELEKTRNEVGLLAAEKNSKIISLNTALAQMDKRYQDVKYESQIWESRIVRIKDLVYSKESEIFIVKDLFWDMYVELMKRRNRSGAVRQPMADREDTESHLKFIQMAINEIRMIVDLAKVSEREERLLLEKAEAEKSRLEALALLQDNEQGSDEKARDGVVSSQAT
ncbi:coiled-coil domain-containing protein 42-like [Ctenocephalides felis]|uniref:coiled-coil domain-containing protein 42-like n=1 Tax=Ctenocephalides felis TaxID=7515 RepID=UPI000E6E1710|nr:coiled-coil domain-containing protein 42-like [Ctenocephalides felis]